MGFLEAVRTCLFRKYFDFRGRASRAEYWWFQVFVVLAGLIAGWVSLSGDTLLPRAVFVIMVLPQLAVTVRRLHDTDRSGWWLLLPAPGYLLEFIPDSLSDRAGSIGLVILLAWGIVSLVFFWFMVQKGDAWENRYGPDPTPDAVLRLSRPGIPPSRNQG